MITLDWEYNYRIIATIITQKKLKQATVLINLFKRGLSLNMAEAWLKLILSFLCFVTECTGETDSCVVQLFLGMNDRGGGGSGQGILLVSGSCAPQFRKHWLPRKTKQILLLYRDVNTHCTMQSGSQSSFSVLVKMAGSTYL